MSAIQEKQGKYEMKKIAIVDDEKDVRELLKLHLERENYSIKLFSNGDDFIESLKRDRYDLLLLDLMLPGSNGLDVCRIIRSDEFAKNMPIIMLTAKGTEADIVLGLELGADDYIIKPFSIRELLARVKTVLRRNEIRTIDKELIIGDLALYPDKFTATLKGKPLDLTSTEFKILKILLSKKGRVLTRTQILDNLGEDRQYVIDRTVDVHIVSIRKKLGNSGDLIHTIRSVGYKISEE